MLHRDRHLGIYLAHRVELITYATNIVRDRSLGEDIVQEAFVRLRSSPENIDEPLAYLKRIIRNLAIDCMRKQVAEQRRIVDDADVASVRESSPSQEEAVLHREELRIVMEAMAELPARTRAALEMHRLEGMKLKEIATALDISVALAHSLVYQGLEHCRKRLAAKT